MAANNCINRDYTTFYVCNTIKVTRFTSSGTFTTDANCINAFVEVQGCSGVGGTAVTPSGDLYVMGGGAGAGAYSSGVYSASTLGASQTVTVSISGNTSFGSLIVCGAGSNGGAGSASGTRSTSNIVVTQGGAGGTVVTPGNAMSLNGSCGRPGYVPQTNYAPSAGNGGMGIYGCGGGLTQTAPGNQGSQGSANTGAGSSGSLAGTSSLVTGAAAMNGCVIVTEYLKA